MKYILGIYIIICLIMAVIFSEISKELIKSTKPMKRIMEYIDIYMINLLLWPILLIRALLKKKKIFSSK